MKKLVSFAILSLALATAYAGGYRVSLQGQRALAMGHTGVAVVNSAELAFFNPAGLVHLENKLSISAGGFGVFSDVAFQNTQFGTSAQTESPVGTPIYLYASYKINDYLAAGLAVYTPYGSTVEWPTDWAGSHLVNRIDLAAIFVQPLVSFKVDDILSFGGGPIFVSGSVEFNRNINRTLTDEQGVRSNVSIEDSGVTDIGWSAGVMFTPTDKLRVGFNYRSEIILNSEDGTATFSNFPNSPGVPANGEQGFTADLPLPAELTVGLSYEFCDKFTFAFDYNRAFWNVYESLDINFEDGNQSLNPREYKNASTYRFGLQYEATDKITLRGGYYFDESPVQSGYFAPETPRNDSHGYTGGLSFQVSDHFAIDASFLYLRFEETTESYDFYQENGQNVPFEGTYKSSAFAPGLGITYKL